MKRKLDEKYLLKNISFHQQNHKTVRPFFAQWMCSNLMTTQNSTKSFVIWSLLTSLRQGAVASIEMLMGIFKLLYTDDIFNLIKQDWVAHELIESLVKAVFGWTVKAILEAQNAKWVFIQLVKGEINLIFPVWCFHDGNASSKGQRELNTSVFIQRVK